MIPLLLLALALAFWVVCKGDDEAPARLLALVRCIAVLGVVGGGFLWAWHWADEYGRRPRPPRNDAIAACPADPARVPAADRDICS